MLLISTGSTWSTIRKSSRVLKLSRTWNGTEMSKKVGMKQGRKRSERFENGSKRVKKGSKRVKKVSKGVKKVKRGQKGSKGVKRGLNGVKKRWKTQTFFQN